MEVRVVERDDCGCGQNRQRFCRDGIQGTEPTPYGRSLDQRTNLWSG